MLRMIANSSKPEWAQPEFWAPFVVVGEPMKLRKGIVAVRRHGANVQLGSGAADRRVSNTHQ
jgi:hypothetical protein